jgi:hypothetical protein
MMNEVLYPGEIGVPHWGNAELPPLILAQALTTPVTRVEGGIGEDVVSLEVRV